jgi:hypothetical protein
MTDVSAALVVVFFLGVVVDPAAPVEGLRLPVK